MLDGKKGVAQKVVYGAFDLIQEKTGKDPLEAFDNAMENIMPSLEVKARRVGGATYQVPMEVRPERRRDPGAALADQLRPQPERKDHDGASCRRDHGRCPTASAALSRSVRTSTRWQRPTRRSLTIVGNLSLRSLR